jgi:hypothetical protein
MAFGIIAAPSAEEVRTSAHSEDAKRPPLPLAIIPSKPRAVSPTGSDRSQHKSTATPDEAARWGKRNKKFWVIPPLNFRALIACGSCAFALECNIK